jgi:hypothetical protein
MFLGGNPAPTEIEPLMDELYEQIIAVFRAYQENLAQLK